MTPRSYRTATDEIQNPTVATYGSVKQMVRKIALGATSINADTDSVYAVDLELDQWYLNGYKLFATHHLGTTHESINVLYVLVRSE